MSEEQMSVEQVLALLAANTNPDEHVLLDDGQFVIQHNSNYPLDAGNGFLLATCPVTLATPAGTDCIGGYDLKSDGTWIADTVQRPASDEETDSFVLGYFPTRNEAIAALWLDRHNVKARIAF